MSDALHVAQVRRFEALLVNFVSRRFVASRTVGGPVNQSKNAPPCRAFCEFDGFARFADVVGYQLGWTFGSC